MDLAKKRKIVQAIICHVTNESSSSTSSSDDYHLLIESDSEECSTNKEITSPFMKTVDKFSGDEFRKKFRLHRHTVALLVHLYKTSKFCPLFNHGGRPRVGARNEIHIFLWYVANTLSYRDLGILFGVNGVTTWKVINRVSSWLVATAHNYIKWPRTSDEIHQIEMGFKNLKGIPGVIGAIGTTHITLDKPTDIPEIYLNEAGNATVILQAVSNASKKFIDVYCGQPGSVDDEKVLKRSTLFRKATEGPTIFGGNNFIVGDAVYPLKSWLIPPYRGTGDLTEQHKQFNLLHFFTRNVVETAFSLMKCRFQRLSHFTERANRATVNNIIVSCCVLHNLCIDQNDPWTKFYKPGIDLYVEEPVGLKETAVNLKYEKDEPVDRRQEVINRLIEKNLL